MIDPIELLSKRSPVFSIGADTRVLHLASIGSRLVELGGNPVPSLAQRTQQRVYGWRRRVASAAAAFVLVVPSVAAATDNVQPDETWYPVKRVVEPLWRLVDRDIVAEHRVEELRVALTEGRVSDTLVSDAELAVAELDPDSNWLHELNELKGQIAPDPAVDLAEDDRDSDEAVSDQPQVSDDSEKADSDEDDSETVSDVEQAPDDETDSSDDDSSDDESSDDGSDDDSDADDESDEADGEDDAEDDDEEDGS